ncbi:MAG: hypothetical protein NVSMB68_01930 [Thermoanaerobaculia bacterium]
MRGQKLFIRPIESGDEEAIRQFLTQNTDAAPASAWTRESGLIGKLVGELVAVAEFALIDDAVQIDNLVVAREVRRKRIGRVMLDEIEGIAAKMDRRRLVVTGTASAEEFFRRTGFEREGARWIRSVKSQSAQRASR